MKYISLWSLTNLLLPGDPFGDPASGIPPSGLLSVEQNSWFEGPSPVRIGVFAATDDASEGAAERVGWSLLPAGEGLEMRMSGLLWPEAVQRLAHGAALTRESKGRGQVILFAVSPTFRASTLASERLLMNAIVYGPGLGASSPIEP